jgi:cytochrome c peroxidase
LRLCGAAALMAAAGVVVAAQTPVAARAPRLAIPAGLDLYMPVPEENALTAEKVALGRRLFFEKLLSRDRSMRCATCHNPGRAFTDGRATSRGVFGRAGARNVPAILNRGYGRTFFWDGRVASLEAQVVQPIMNSKELDLPLDEAVRRLDRSRAYRRQFLKAFGREVNAEDLARALASYVRSVFAAEAPIDRYMAGEPNALTEQEREGLRIFRGRGNCVSCHLGPSFTDEQFHNTGVAWRGADASGPRDAGRYAVTGRDADRGAFKTPTLREIARTAPYMHNGSLATLQDVVEFYDGGGHPNPHLDPEIRRLGLTAAEKQALVAFLRSLRGRVREGWHPADAARLPAPQRAAM